MDASCKTIADACEAAGFTRSRDSGKDILQDCMRPILEGTAASGLPTVDASVVSTCKSNMPKGRPGMPGGPGGQPPQ